MTQAQLNKERRTILAAYDKRLNKHIAAVEKGTIAILGEFDEGEYDRHATDPKFGTLLQVYFRTDCPDAEQGDTKALTEEELRTIVRAEETLNEAERELTGKIRGVEWDCEEGFAIPRIDWKPPTAAQTKATMGKIVKLAEKVKATIENIRQADPPEPEGEEED